MTDFNKWEFLSRDFNTVTVGEWLEACKNGMTVIINDGEVRGCWLEVK